ncbi:hypothetical protein ACJA88_015046 [Fusarium oxysporum]
MVEKSKRVDHQQTHNAKRQRVGSHHRHGETSNTSRVAKVATYNEPLIASGMIYAEKLEEGAIRVMTLSRGSGSDPVVCGLKKIRFGGQPSSGEVSSYDALSYVWGSEEDPEFINLCQNRFAITQNLFEALVYLRLPDSDRTLWIDAICINQQDIVEKETQIKLMHQIYGYAKRVLSWIGTADAGSHRIFENLHRMQDMVQDIFPLAGRPIFGTTLTLGDQEVSNRDETALRELLDRPYWFRAWIFQEMKFASSLIVKCGADEVPYEWLEAFHIQKQHSCVGGETTTSFVDNLDSSLPLLHTDQSFSYYFLDCLLNKHCQERHDSIFAFWNLFPDDIKRSIPINYTISPDELLLQSARAIINSTRSLYIFVIKGRQVPPTDTKEHWQTTMPSWCPYLATPRNSFVIKPQSMPSVFAEEATVSFSTNNKLLVRGFVIGRVAQSIRRPKHVRATRWTDADLKQWWDYYIRCLKIGLHGTPHDVLTRLKSLWHTTQTLLADQDEDSDGVQYLFKLATGEMPVGTNDLAARTAMRVIERNTRSRKLCLFRVGPAVLKALQSNKTARKVWLNRLTLVPHIARRGDFICVILGCPLAVVLRRTGNTYRILGEAFADTSKMGPLEVSITLRDFFIE